MKTVIYYLAKYRDIVVYGIVGVLSTMVNIALYYLFARVLLIDYLFSVAFAFIAATVFAFFGNKYFVFRSKTRVPKEFAGEFVKFMSMRLIMCGFDVAFMFVSVGVLGFNDLWMKIISNVVVIICNYLFSKLIIFRKRV